MKSSADVHVRWLSTVEGGRATKIHIRSDPVGQYRPHLRVGTMGEYLGVRFLDGEPPTVEPGETGVAKIEFMYDGVDYSGLVAGTEFEIVEGCKVVGRGTIVRRFEG